MLPSDLVPPDQGWFAQQIAELRQQIAELRAARTAESTTISGGTTVVQDANGRDIVRMGQVPGIFGGTASGFDLVRPGSTRVLHYESPFFFGLFDTSGRLILSDDVTSGQGLARPWLPVPLYRMFEPSAPAAGATGYSTVAPGTLAKWEGRISVSHSWLQVDGVWGQSTGSNTGTYEVLLGGTSVGSWNTTGLEVSTKGPFDVSDYVGVDWLKIEIGITASSGTGTLANQVLGCYLRQT